MRVMHSGIDSQPDDQFFVRYGIIFADPRSLRPAVQGRAPVDAGHSQPPIRHNCSENIFNVEERLSFDWSSLMLTSIARGLCAFFGMFTLWNCVLRVVKDVPDPNRWWIGVPDKPLFFILLVGAALTLCAYAIRPFQSAWRRRIGVALITSAFVIACWNAIVYYRLVADASITTRLAVPIPFSLVVAVVLGIVSIAMYRNRPAGGIRCFSVSAPVLVATILAFPLLQMVCFGTTDYRRNADAIVVFGARAYADGRLSDALEDRMRTACELFHAGLAQQIICSGGPGDGDIHEVEAMRDYAMSLGVPETAFVLDRNGLTTADTVAESNDIFEQYEIRSALVVSHGYHLPRIKQAYQQAGLTVYTVPARPKYVLTKMPVFMAREVAAFWAYYVR